MSTRGTKEKRIKHDIHGADGAGGDSPDLITVLVKDDRAGCKSVRVYNQSYEQPCELEDVRLAGALSNTARPTRRLVQDPVAS